MNLKTCSCGKTLSASETHSQCMTCRAVDRDCIECGRSFSGTRRKCFSCSSLASNARQRDARMGLATGQFDQMVAEQGGLCAVCFRAETLTRVVTSRVTALSVDHDHSCCPGKESCGRCVRGLICRNCNTLLGMAEDNILILQSAITYLTKFSFVGDQLSESLLGTAQVGGETRAAYTEPIPKKGK